MRAGSTQSQRRGVAIFGLLLAIFAVRTFVDTPGLSLSFLAVFPIVLAAFALGRTPAVVCAVLALVLSVVIPIVNPATHISSSAQAFGAFGRGSVFIGLALLVSGMFETEFVTALCAVFAADRSTVTWASAGHPPPSDLDRGEPLARARPCPPLGIEPVLHGEAVTARLVPGSGLLLYTDGLPEARTARDVPRHMLFGEDAARDALCALRGASPADIVAGLRAAAVEHADGVPADDLCLVAVRRDVDAAAQPQAA